MTGKRRQQEPNVSIFWLVWGKLLIDSSALSEAEGYGDFKIHPRGHAGVWEQFQQSGLVFPEMEYEESPRGRVMFNTETQRFKLLADRCILRDKDLVRTILAELKLPSHTLVGTDEHYRCSRCLQGEVRMPSPMLQQPEFEALPKGPRGPWPKPRSLLRNWKP